jgi:hypothetical protein
MTNQESLRLLDAVDLHLARVSQGESLNPLVARDWLYALSGELRQRIQETEKAVAKGLQDTVVLVSILDCVACELCEEHLNA